MKRTISLIISAVILVSTLLLSSCGPVFGKERIFPEGYTGGFGIDYGSRVEFYWVETYEEAVQAMELLKSHGSTFAKTAIFSYEGDLFDTKYCFKIYGRKADYVKFGDNPYDRYAADVEVSSFGFFEDVTIDELVYSDINDYSFLYFSPTSDFTKTYADKTEPFVDNLQFEWNETHTGGKIYHGKDHILNIGGKEISDECLDVILNSLEFIGFND